MEGDDFNLYNDLNLPDVFGCQEDWSNFVPSVLDIQLPQAEQELLPVNSNIGITAQECDSTTFSSEIDLSNVHQEPQTSGSNEIPNIRGSYNFHVYYPSEDGSRGNAAWTYSERTDELYLKMNTDCAFKVHVQGPVPPTAFVRVTPVFRRPEDQHRFPERCVNHEYLTHETNRDHLQHPPEFIVRCYMPGTQYVTEANNKRCLLLPCNVDDGQNLCTYVLKFMCRTSCVGGMNRRPFSLVFTLEDRGMRLGQHVKKIHVCACPRRDRRNEEAHLDRPNWRLQVQQPPPPPRPSAYENFELLPETVALFSQPFNEEPPLVQDVKRACKRVVTLQDENKDPKSTNTTKNKRQKVYTLKVESKAIYDILIAMLPVVEANLKKMDARSTDSES